METPVKSSQVGVRILDLLALAGLAGLVWLAADPTRLGRALQPGVTAGVLIWVPLILLLRTIVENRPPARVRLGGRLAAALGVSEPTGARRTLVPAIAGSTGTALGFLGGWAAVHPLTDYPSAARLLVTGLAAGLGIGLAVGLTVHLWSATDEKRTSKAARFAFLGSAIVTLGGIAWWDPARGWTFPLAQSVLAGLLVAALLFLATAATVLLALSQARIARRALLALIPAMVPAIVLAWVSQPLPGRETAPSDWPHAVLLITVDTLRADHLGAYGYERNTSPRIDALAAESVLFERAYAPMPTTDPSHVALLTGSLPRSTGVMKNGVAGTGQPSLASWFLERGYRTGAVTSRAHLDPAALRLPGFQTASMPEQSSEAEQAHRRATNWIERHGDRPFFLWVHFWDPHSPYAPPPEDAAPFVAGLKPSRFQHGIDPYVPRSRPHTDDEIRWATALYDGEIHHADAWVGQLIEETRERFGAGEVLVVLTSDHGETLGEFDREQLYAFDHGKLLARHELHVPLLVGWPGRLPAGRRVEQPIATAGVAATLGSLLGDEFSADVAGFVDLLTPASHAASFDTPAQLVERRLFAEPVQLPFLAVPELGLIERNWLYVENPVRGAALYDVESDPRGQRNLVDLEAERVQQLSDRLRALAEEYPKLTESEEPVDREKIEMLRSLGYIE